jgi:nicotinamidase-related amidase
MSGVASEPRSTAIVVVECQGGVVGAQSQLPALAEAAAPVLPVIDHLLAAARQAGAFVAHLLYVPLVGNQSSNTKAPLQRGLSKRIEGWEPGHPAAEIVPQIRIDPSDLRLVRHQGLSPTHGTETFKILRNLGVTTIVATGVSTNIAIPTLTVEAVDEDFSVIIPSDAVAGIPAEHHDSVMRHVLPNLATVTTSAELVAAWET